MKVIVILANMLVLLFLAGCATSEPESFHIESIKTYKDIPGVTDEDIAAIELLKTSRSVLIYGQMLETESFIRDGSYAGFAVKLSNLLSDLFGIEFALEIYDWDTLKSGIDSKQIDFTGDFITIYERTDSYYMTFPIAERTQKIFMLSENYNKIMKEQDISGLRVGFLEDSVEPDQIKQYYPDLDFYIIGISSFDSAVNMLESGEIDVFVAKGVVDPAFDQHGTIRSRDFFPLVYTPVSLATANPELQPMIRVMDKYLEAGGIDILHRLYMEGNKEYARYKLANSFTEEERAYLTTLAENDETVKAALQIGNYPICFYNSTEEKFEGIAVDVLSEVSDLTGIIFESAGRGDTGWPELYQMLQTGEASVVSQLMHSPERDGQFLWPDRPHSSSHYALISRYDYPNLANYQVIRRKVGTVVNSDFQARYNEWFPDSNNLILYNNQIDALSALESGEITLMMGSDYLLLMQQNFYEKPGYKVNIQFPEPMYSYLGFNINETVLCSIVNKALDFVHLDTINNDWTSRGYDYTSRLTQQRMIYMMIVLAILVVIVILAIFFFIKLRFYIIKLRINESELKVQKEVAQEASRTKSAFLANMSHEIRTPLTAVLGLTELVLKTEQLNDETYSNIVKVNRAGETLLSLINDILDISKIEAGKFELHFVEYDLPSMINDTVTQSLMYIGDKPIEFILNIYGDLPHYLYGDDLRVKQILNNLLSNAFKFTKEGTVELGIRCKKEENTDIVWLTAWVRDTGMGIRPEDKAKLFTLYGKMEEDNDRNGTGGKSDRRTQGTGLGLSISKRVAEAMDGFISVESEYGKGSLFTVKLRQKHVSDATIGPEVVESLKKFNYSIDSFKCKDNSYINLSYARVLVVDDNITNLDVAKGLLSFYGMRVDCVTSGQQAIDAIRNEIFRYHAIFMDHMMPEMDGIEATRIIREEIGTEYARTIPIIALTANAIAGNEKMFLSKGFQAFISKPIDMDRLDTVVRHLIRDKGVEALLLDPVINAEGNGEQYSREQNSDERRNHGQLDYNIPGLDINKGFARFDFNKNVYLSVLSSFAINTKPLIDSIQDIDNIDLTEYSVIIHGIKGSAFGIFAESAGDKAYMLEKAAKSGDYDYVVANNREFINDILRLVDDIENFLANIQTSKKPVKDKPEEKLLAKLLYACDSFDIDEMDAVMAEIEQFQYDSDGELVAWIREQLVHGKYKNIKEKLQTMIED